MFGIGGLELVIIIAFALFIFGPDKMPEIGKLLGRGLRMFQEAKDEVETTIKTEVFKPEDAKMMRQLQRDFESLKSSMAHPEEIFKPAPVKPRKDESPEVGPEPVSEEVILKQEEKLEAAETLEASVSAEVAELERQLAEAKKRAATEVSAEAPEQEAVKASEDVSEQEEEPPVPLSLAERQEALKAKRSQKVVVHTSADDIWAATTQEGDK